MSAAVATSPGAFAIDIEKMSSEGLIAAMNMLSQETTSAGGVWFFQFHATFDPIYRNYVFRLAARTL